MNVKATIPSTLAAILLCFAIAIPVARAQGNPPNVNPTHYWTYHVLPVPTNPQAVAVMDQFFPQFVPNTTDQLQRLVNWVKKTDPSGVTSPVLDPNLHYTWWNLQGKYPVNKFVQVTNQFGSYPVNVYNLEFMLVPALKYWPPGTGDPQAPPPVANHYLCYKANGFPAPPAPYGLVDEWRQDLQAPGPMEFLCVPCWKQHNGQIYPPLETDTHLALYPVHPSSQVFDPFVIDQFLRGPLTVQQIPTEYLLVPSTKVEIVTDTKKSSWGKIKMLYR